MEQKVVANPSTSLSRIIVLDRICLRTSKIWEGQAIMSISISKGRLSLIICISHRLMITRIRGHHKIE